MLNNNTIEEYKILYNHYVVTNEQQITYVHKRNKYFVYLLFVMSLQMLTTIYGANFLEVLNGVFGKWAGKNTNVDVIVINSIALTFTLWLSLLYYKSILTVERGFLYIRKIEEDINTLSSTIKIMREGKFYKDHKTIFSKRVRFIYKYIFPSLVVFISLGTTIVKMTLVINGFVLFELFLALLISYISMAFIFNKKQQAT